VSVVSAGGPALAGVPADWWLRLGHDLRGPVAPMRMAVQMLRGGWVGPADQEEALRMIDRQIDSLLGSIEDLGELMRLNAGVFAFDAQLADLGAALDRVAGKAALERWLQERQTRLAVEPCEEDLLAPHDPQRLVALLEFLVRKSAQHAGSGRLLVLAARRAGNLVRFSLVGSGPSLAADPEVRLLAGESDALEECEARALVMREIVRRHRLVFEPLADGIVGFAMEAAP
jgi:signal transduction histidine kinase